MISEALFRDYWWIIFPFFGMGMAVWGMLSSERRTSNVLDLIRSYVDQGKEPPAELLRLAAQESDAAAMNNSGRQNGRGWNFVVFAALAAGFGAGWYMVQGESYAFAFAIVGITMGVMAVGALLIQLFSRR